MRDMSDNLADRITRAHKREEQEQAQQELADNLRRGLGQGVSMAEADAAIRAMRRSLASGPECIMRKELE